MAQAPAEFLAHLEKAAARFSALLADGDLAAPVPACPGWDLRTLTGHLGGIHRWARDAVVEKRPTDADRAFPADRVQLRAWFDDGAGALLDTLRETAPSADCWTFGPRPRTAAFWCRRQAHETAMHVRDAEQALGTPQTLAPDLVLDGIDEVVTMFVPRQVRRGRLDPRPDVIELRSTDAGATWPLALTTNVVADPRGADAEVVGTVSAPAETLLLLLWRRVPPEAAGVRIDGDAVAVRAVLGAALTP